MHARTIGLSSFAVMIFAAVSSAQQPKTYSLGDPNFAAELIRRVELELADPKGSYTIPTGVKVRAQDLNYTFDASGPRLRWKYYVESTPTPAQAQAIKTALNALLQQVLGQSGGVFVSDADARKILAAAVFEPTTGAPIYVQPVMPDPVPGHIQWLYRHGTYGPIRPSVPTLGWGLFGRVCRAEPIEPSLTPPIPAQATFETLYADARDAFQSRRFRHAAVLFTQAAAKNPHDARVWYFKALAERACGEETRARESAQRGAALAALEMPERAAIYAALENVQGEARAFLTQAAIADVQTAEVVLRRANRPQLAKAE